MRTTRPLKFLRSQPAITPQPPPTMLEYLPLPSQELGRHAVWLLINKCGYFNCIVFGISNGVTDVMTSLVLLHVTKRNPLSYELQYAAPAWLQAFTGEHDQLIMAVNIPESGNFDMAWSLRVLSQTKSSKTFRPFPQ
ncbi:hypothetical protein E4T56_gene12460 [Termitomyces sp. T112]|nr:hypothetical protein E4T56_gene12460 [Termitomyces sp. T112]